MDLIVHKLNVKLLDNINASSTSVLSDPISIQGFSLYCVHYSWSGFSAVDPLLEILGSNSLDQPFVTIDNYIPSGITGGRLVNVEKAGYAYVKIKWSCTSANGAITASINGKVI